jgi:hypothetical protein
MIDMALDASGRIGLLAISEPTIARSRQQFSARPTQKKGVRRSTPPKGITI